MEDRTLVERILCADKARGTSLSAPPNIGRAPRLTIGLRMRVLDE
jgi:hypothetical protein